MSQSQTLLEPKIDEKVKSLPLWKVIILNDEEHSYDFVVQLLMEVFSHNIDKAIQLTIEIDKEGQAIVDTTTKERAELKQDQVKSKGRDPRMGARSTGPLKCVIEPAE
jgi:ATP-dependent Clp protease adaptor protein ClpS